MQVGIPRVNPWCKSRDHSYYLVCRDLVKTGTFFVETSEAFLTLVVLKMIIAVGLNKLVSYAFGPQTLPVGLLIGLSIGLAVGLC